MEGVWTFAIAFIALYMTAMVDSQSCNKKTCETQEACRERKCIALNGTCMPKKECSDNCPWPNECKTRGRGWWCRKHRNCKCCIPRCGACIEPINGYTLVGNHHSPALYPPPYALGTLCEYYCDDGHHLEPEDHRINECIKNGINGSWLYPTPQCIPNTCDTCGEPQNGGTTGDHSPKPNPIGTICHYHCDAGHSLEGHNTTECLANETWSHHIPLCKPNTCDTCGEPQNGFTTGDNHPLNHIGTTCTYHCDEGHHLDGHETATCLPNELWSNPIPECRQNTCETCGVPADGKTKGDHSPKPNPIGTICDYSCDPGYFLNGSIATQCLANETWSNPIPQCIRWECPNDRKCNRENGQCYHIDDPIFTNHTLCPNISPAGGRAWCKDMQNCACCYGAAVFPGFK